ncbi:maltose O-acetyltransferase [Algoriphagus sp. 4150]|uniref:sugar O-acetyltransferase n=1 Tax=Algoriphagus sp. 4150 TaxID=2817756 RepID=UPI00285E675B|nr:sugar O-acetyltransferase [Algoriphagus sp. 4150]MDR7130773.1 maltose O-acetyltransferase [Algoriphagus sp. 4150]
MTEKEKMLAGELYQAGDPELAAERLETRKLLKTINDSDPEDPEYRISLFKKLFGKAGENLWVEPPFYCDYGSNIEVGDDVFFNFNCVVLDVCKVTLGDRVFVGPNVQFYSATHPLDPVSRGQQWEYGKPITIGSDVWIGGSAVLCPGVSIGERTVVAAGAVVTKDFPSDVVIGGNPAKVIKYLE